MVDGLLTGLTVIDLSPTRVGAQMSQVFADHGADVVWVEPPGGGALRREPAFPFWARGKRSVELDLGADLRVHDDHLPTDLGPVLEPRRAACDADELRAADIVVILVDHPDLPYDEICSCAELVLDTKGALRGRDFAGEVL